MAGFPRRSRPMRARLRSSAASRTSTSSATRFEQLRSTKARPGGALGPSPNADLSPSALPRSNLARATADSLPHPFPARLRRSSGELPLPWSPSSSIRPPVSPRRFMRRLSPTRLSFCRSPRPRYRPPSERIWLSERSSAVSTDWDPRSLDSMRAPPLLILLWLMLRLVMESLATSPSMSTRTRSSSIRLPGMLSVVRLGHTLGLLPKARARAAASPSFIPKSRRTCVMAHFLMPRVKSRRERLGKRSRNSSAPR
mmetsp:Transcript_72204/g.145268  ORF Transcript_72204/g.145268 Transcript_72204/m.145268 type:complete len:255 (+) Transcript_72204:310-1074(+)